MTPAQILQRAQYVIDSTPMLADPAGWAERMAEAVRGVQGFCQQNAREIYSACLNLLPHAIEIAVIVPPRRFKFSFSPEESNMAWSLRPSD